MKHVRKPQGMISPKLMTVEQLYELTTQALANVTEAFGDILGASNEALNNKNQSTHFFVGLLYLIMQRKGLTSNGELENLVKEYEAAKALQACFDIVSGRATKEETSEELPRVDTPLSVEPQCHHREGTCDCDKDTGDSELFTESSSRPYRVFV
jgi:hypothetical protein